MSSPNIETINKRQPTAKCRAMTTKRKRAKCSALEKTRRLAKRRAIKAIANKLLYCQTRKEH